MPQPTRDPFQVLVVRASLHDAATAELVVEFDAIGPTPEDDRLLGRAATADDAAAILREWLVAIVEEARVVAGIPVPPVDTRLTDARRPRREPPATLLGRHQENGR